MYAALPRDTSAAPSRQLANLTVRPTAIVIVAAAGMACVAMVTWSPFPGLTLRIATEELFPSTISWEGKTAWKRCDSAIVGQTSWPSSPQGACAAMHLCANEAPLSPAQTRVLYRAIRATPGCQEP
jgi:hypothetical protein